MEYDAMQLSVILGLSATVWAMMEAVLKPALKQFFQRISNRVVVSPPVQYGVFRVVGVLAGIVAVLTVDGASFANMWYIEVGEGAQWIDVLVTGVIVGLGDRAIHWIVDFMEDNGNLLKGLLEKRQGASTETGYHDSTPLS